MSVQGGFLFEVVSETQTRLSSTLMIDPKVPLVPPHVIDWAMKYIAGTLMPMWHKQSLKCEPGGKLCHLREGVDKPVYEEMVRRLAALNGAVPPDSSRTETTSTTMAA